MCNFGPRFFFSSRRRHTRCGRDWSSDVCSSDLEQAILHPFHASIEVRDEVNLWVWQEAHLMEDGLVLRTEPAQDQGDAIATAEMMELAQAERSRRVEPLHHPEIEEQVTYAGLHDEVTAGFH